MSDPMSSVEIEDVLSSIRRLVSEDLRPGPVAMQVVPQTDAPAAARSPASRLILTPQLRVVPPSDRSVQQAPAAEARVEPVADSPAEEDWVEEADWLEAPAAPIGWAAPIAPPEPMMTQDRILELATRLTEEAPVAPAAPPAAPHRFTLTAAASATPDDCEPEPAMEAPLFLATPVVAPLTLTASMISRARSGAASETAPAEPTSAPEAAWDAPVDAFDHIPAMAAEAAPEAAAEPTLAWADRAAAEAIAAIEADVASEVSARLAEPAQAQTDAPPPPQVETPEQYVEDPDPDEIIYDEELLRGLVRDILCEELAGALGEKITRSIRKMVRAEMAQLTALRGMD